MKVSTVLLLGLAGTVLARPIPLSHPARFEHEETIVNGQVVQDEDEAIPQGSVGSGAPLINLNDDSDSDIFAIANELGRGAECITKYGNM